LRVLIGPRLDGYRSLPLFYNEMLHVASGDVLMVGNDDMIFKTIDWSSKILAKANEYPDGVFDIGVDTFNRGNFTFATVSRRAVDAMGFLYDPSIFWGDIFLRDVMAAFGRTPLLTSVRIDHDWAGHNPDETFNAGEETRRANWNDAHAAAVRRAIDALTPLMGVTCETS
jgi:hypothetical protein